MRVYRETLCPYCKKKYMDQYYDDDGPITIDGYDGTCYISTCPKCNTELFVFKGKLEAVIAMSIPEEQVHWPGWITLR